MTVPPTLPIGNVFLSILLNPKNVGKICQVFGTMPNFDLPTLGGHVFWDTLAESKGWKLQQNMFTGHCRILDPGDYRKAWGSERALYQLLINLSK